MQLRSRPLPMAPLTTKPPPVFAALTETVLRLPPKMVRQLWRAIFEDTSPTAKLFTYSVIHVTASKDPYKSLIQFMVQHPPRTVIELVERGVECMRLNRREGNRIEEAVLQQTDRRGRWK
jgi:hypothetical protein